MPGFLLTEELDIAATVSYLRKERQRNTSDLSWLMQRWSPSSISRRGHISVLQAVGYTRSSRFLILLLLVASSIM